MVGRVVDRLPRDDADGDHRKERERADDGDPHRPGRPVERARCEEALVAGRVELERDQLPLRPCAREQAADEEQERRRPTSPRSRAPSRSTASPPGACSAGRRARSGAGRRRQHDDRRRQQQQAAAGEEPGRPRSHESGRTSVTTIAPGRTSRHREAVRRRRAPAPLDTRPPASGVEARAGEPVSPPSAGERSLDLVHLGAVGREVAGPERRLGELEVGVRVLDEARDVGRQPAAGRRRPAAGVGGRTGRSRTARARARRRAGDGPGPPPCAASSSVQRLGQRRPQTMVVGLATTIRWNSGNADEVDWR